MEFKIIFSLCCSAMFWLILAYPTTFFASWGRKLTGDYRTFLVLIASIHMVATLLVMLYSIWTN